MKPEWMKNFILRAPENESGGGGVFEIMDEGASSEDPAPAEDRTSKVEARLDRLTQSLEGFMSKTTKQEEESNSRVIEQQITSAIQRQEALLDEAEDKLAAAFDDGDGRTIAKAQRVVAQEAAKVERVKAQADQYRQQLKSSERRSGGAGSTDLDTSNLDSWKQRHVSWYGVDKDMTKAAHELDAQIRSAGVLASGSKEYFDAIDRQMRQKFPDRFGGTPPTGGSQQRGNGQPSSTNRVRIPASVADGFRRMGINIDDPDTAKRMVKNREKAVSKGWLNDQPATGRIFQR